MILNWAKEYCEEIITAKVDVEKIHRDTDREISNLNHFGNRILTAFAELIS